MSSKPSSTRASHASTHGCVFGYDGHSCVPRSVRRTQIECLCRKPLLSMHGGHGNTALRALYKIDPEATAAVAIGMDSNSLMEMRQQQLTSAAAVATPTPIPAVDTLTNDGGPRAATEQQLEAGTAQLPIQSRARRNNNKAGPKRRRNATNTALTPASAAGGGGASLSRKRQQRTAPSTSSTAAIRQQRGTKHKAAAGPGHHHSTPRTVSSVTYADVGGMEAVLQDVRELIEYPLTHPEIYRHLGVEPPHGVLLHGPPGCGKTLLANAVAGELGVPFLRISAPEIVSGMSGESESKLRALFQQAREAAPCLLFIDEIDAITPKRETARREMERRIVAQLLTCMDSLNNASATHADTADGATAASAGVETQQNQMKQDSGAGGPQTTTGLALAPPPPPAPVVVVGATNRPDSLDPALRRAGRFDREIAIGIPDEHARERILRVLCREMRVDENLDFEAITRQAVGYVGADLAALTREAAVIAVNRIFASLADASTMNQQAPFKRLKPSSPPSPVSGAMVVAAARAASQAGNSLTARTRASAGLRRISEPLTPAQLAPLSITMDDFSKAMEKVQPSSKREGFATKPDVSWADVGSLENLREELTMCVLQPILHPDQFTAIGLSVPAGVLLFGPPGCGKTLVAKAVANESGASFLSVKGPELLNQFVGESERAVRLVFQRARASAPCIIFFDELDALCPKRGSSGAGGGTHVSERVVNQLLTEMDGLESRRNVFVVAATNRPDIIDPAMLRPGRLEKLLYVPLPDASGRAAILKKHVRKTPLGSSVDVEAIAKDVRGEGFSGADVAALVREATVTALKEAQTEVFGEGNFVEARRGETLTVSVEQRHFEHAFTKVFPSVSDRARRRYEGMMSKLRTVRSQMGESAATAAVSSANANTDASGAVVTGVAGATTPTPIVPRTGK